MTLREAAQRALEAIDRALPHAPHCGEFDALADMADALRAALAEDALERMSEDERRLGIQMQPVQEPVAWMDIARDGTRLSVRMWSDGNFEEVPLYTVPRTEQEPLADMAVFDLADALLYGGTNYGVLAFARAIERAHGIGCRDE